MWTRSSCRLSRNLSEDVLLSPGPRPVSRRIEQTRLLLGSGFQCNRIFYRRIITILHLFHLTFCEHKQYHISPQKSTEISVDSSHGPRKRDRSAPFDSRGLFCQYTLFGGGTCTAYRYVKKSAVKQQISPFWPFPQYQ